ncbi:MAG: hypothetical protein AABY22_11275 [Nanoarchaeota archaeon]
MKKFKTKYCYLVYCNKEPIVCGVYLSKKKALDYAYFLITEREKTIFSTCLQIKDGQKEFSDDGCFIQVIRRNIIK